VDINIIVPGDQVDNNVNQDNVRAPPNNQHRLGISLGIQNVRSLNISTKNEITTQKILALVSQNTDFIFISDARLNTLKQIAAINDLEKSFFFNGYKFLHNSQSSIRGVGILIKKNVFEKLQILNRVDSACGNFMVLHINFNNTELVLCPIYGPNRDNEIGFYNNLKNELKNFACPIVCGGDWNATYDNSPVETNLDTVNMRNLPSILRTSKIRDLCTELNLIEPYRTLFPNRKEYTFIPSGIQETNRSRIDFFLISNNIFGTGTNVRIPNCLASTLFDHKSVQLFLNKPRPGRRNIVKDCILKNIDLPSHVKAAVFECYLQHFVADPQNPPIRIDESLLNIGRIMTLLTEIKNLEIKQAVEGHNERDDLLISGKRGEINLIFDDMPDLEFFENLPIGPNPALFFPDFDELYTK